MSSVAPRTIKLTRVFFGGEEKGRERGVVYNIFWEVLVVDLTRSRMKTRALYSHSANH